MIRVAIQAARRAGRLFLIGFAFAAAMVYVAIAGGENSNAAPGTNADGP